MPLTPIKSKWIDYGDTSTNASAGTISDLVTTDIRLIRFTSATTLESIANGLTSGNSLPREVLIVNATGSVMTIKNETGTTAANRILTGTAADISLAVNAAAYLRYDSTSSRWRVVGLPAGNTGTIATGDAGKLSYYTSSTTIDDTASGTAADGLFWQNTLRSFLGGSSNTNTAGTRVFIYGSGNNCAMTTQDAAIIGQSISYASGSGTVFGYLLGGLNVTATSNITGSLAWGQALTLNGSTTWLGGISNVVLNAGASFVHGGFNKFSSAYGGCFGNSNIVWGALGSSSFAFGSGLRVVGVGAFAFIGDAVSPGNKTYAIGDNSIILSMRGAATQASSTVTGRESVAGYRHYSWTRPSAASTTITIDLSTEYTAAYRTRPMEYVNGAVARFFDMAGTDGFTADTVAADLTISSVSFSSPTLTFDIPAAANLGSKTSGRVVIKTGAEYAQAEGYQSWAKFLGQKAQASGSFGVSNVIGDAQTSVLTLRRSTTDATPTILTVDNTANGWLRVPENTAWAFTITVIGKKSATITSNMYKFTGAVSRLSGDPALVGTVDVFQVEGDAAWDCSVAVNTTNDSLDVTVTGAAATNIKWVARVELTEVTTD